MLVVALFTIPLARDKVLGPVFAISLFLPTPRKLGEELPLAVPYFASSRLCLPLFEILTSPSSFVALPMILVSLSELSFH